MDWKGKLELALIIGGLFALIFVGPILIATQHPELMGP